MPQLLTQLWLSFQSPQNSRKCRNIPGGVEDSVDPVSDYLLRTSTARSNYR